jgi:general secretion pathway protein A
LYKKFYQLNDDPFRLTPDPSYIYMTAQHREALAGLVYSACTRPGLSVLAGEAGTGKTTLLYTLMGLLEKRRFVIALCNNPTLTRDEFYDFVLLKLGVDCPSMLKSRRLVALQEVLTRNRADARPTMLIVDEAQRLSTELLEEIRLLLNMETPRDKMLEIVLAGQPELAETLSRPELRQLKQRISCVCRLEPLGMDGVRDYIAYRLAKAGRSEAALFPEETIRAIYEYSAGIPRVINALCNTALRNGFAIGAQRIEADLIHEAARDWDFLPADTKSVRRAAHEESMAFAAVRDFSHGSDGRPVPDGNESHANRQKSLSFFGNLIDRWK